MCKFLRLIYTKTIEFCPLKLMIILTFFAIVFTFLVVFLENFIYSIPKTQYPHPFASENITNASSLPCWEIEEYFVKHYCFPCSQFEKVSKHIPACEPTGLKEMVSCKISGDVYRSCNKVIFYEERNFFTFIFLSAVCGIIGTFVVNARRKELDTRMMIRINQQISAGV